MSATLEDARAVVANQPDDGHDRLSTLRLLPGVPAPIRLQVVIEGDATHEEPSDADDLSERQVEILEAIAAYRAQHDGPPSFQDVIRTAGLGSNGQLSYHLRHLRERGYVAPAGFGSSAAHVRVQQLALTSRGWAVVGVAYMPPGEAVPSEAVV
jgi:hypothetical protein